MESIKIVKNNFTEEQGEIKRTFYSYDYLEVRWGRNRRSIWRWWAKDKILEPPYYVGKFMMGWKIEQIERFEAAAEIVDV